MKTPFKLVTLVIVLINVCVLAQTDALTILPNGNVGMGTTTPTQNLDVRGNGIINSVFLGDVGHGENWAGFSHKNALGVNSYGFRHHVYGIISLINIKSDPNGFIGFRVNNEDKMVIKPDGNVGVGMTDPKIIIDVKENSIIGSSLQPQDQHDAKNRGVKVSFGHQGTNFVGMRTLVGAGTKGCGNSGDITFDTWECNTDNSREVMRINGTGNVGIGTAIPTYAKLQIKGGDTHQLLAVNRANSDVPALYLGNKNTNDAVVASNNSHLIFGRDKSNDYTEYMRIQNETGNVGIGTDNPTQAKLVVSGSVNHTPKFIKKDILGNLYQNQILNQYIRTNSAIPYSIYASGHIAAKQYDTFSDIRIKNIFGVSNAAKDLETLSKIEITDYTMIDTFGKGNQMHKKVIAQQVKKVYPQAVSSNLTDVIPNIYALSMIKNGWIKTNTKDLVVGDKVKLIFSEDEALVDVLEIKGDTIKVTSTQEGQVFVYGKQVSDFHTVDYEAIAMLNVSATQALLQRIELLESDKKKLTRDFEKYKTSVNERLSKIEQALQTETVMN